jgi:hypothetical protein
MKRPLPLIATILALAVPVFTVYATEKKVLSKGTASDGGHHSDADASYSIVQVDNDNVVITFNYHFASVKRQGGGKGIFQFVLLDTKGTSLANWDQTLTIGRNHLKGKDHKRGSRKITLIGQKAADFIKDGGSVQIVALVDDPTGSAELKALYKSLTGNERKSDDDTKKKG